MITGESLATATRMSGYSANRVVGISVVVLACITLAALIGPFLSDYDYQTTNLERVLEAPSISTGHYFGTDSLGRDLFARSMYGVQISMLVAVVASLVSLVIGVVYGAIAGYVGGRVDSAMMRIVDTLYSVPFIFFVILLTVFFERNVILIFVAIGAVNWLDMARIVRGQTLSLKEREFVQAARLAGSSPTKIVFRHITPNLAGLVVVYVTLTVPQALMVESFLSFLGLGVQEPQTSLGSLVNDGTEQMERAPWVLVIPATLLAIILLSFNFLGDGLRDFFDVRQKSR